MLATAVLVAWAALLAPPGSRSCVRPRALVSLTQPCSVEAWFVERCNCSEADAERAARKLLPGVREWVCGDWPRSDAQREALQQRLSLSEAELRKVVLSYPPVLAISFEGNIETKLGALLQRLALSEAELRKLVLSRPAVLGYSFEGNIEPKLAALQERLAISGAELRLLVLRVPSVLTSNLDATIWPKVDFLQQELSLDGTGATQLLLKAPSLLSGSLDASLRPNLEVWRTQLAREGLDAREVFVREPSRALVLSLSNERRTVPRFERGRAAARC